MGENRKQAPENRARLRRAVLRLREAGKTRVQIAQQLGVTEGTVEGVLRSLVSSGVVANRRTAFKGPSRQRLDRWQKVLELTRQGYPPQGIAATLGVSGSTLERDLVDLRDLGLIGGPVRRQRSANLQQRRQRVRNLRQAGKTVAQIAEELGVSRATVNCDMAALRRAVPVRHNPRQRNLGPRAAQRADLLLAILRLRQQGMALGEIAARLKVSPKKVATESQVLVRLGWTEDRRGRAVEVAKIGPGESRYETIVGMTRRGATLEEIGARLGLTRERVRQLRDWIEAAYGPIVRDLLTPSEAARYLGISEGRLKRLATKGAIRPHGSPASPRYKKEDLQALRRGGAATEPPLVGGSYQMPRCRVGTVLTCACRDCNVKVAGFTDAPTVWPYCHNLIGGGSPSIIVCGDLERAVRTESLIALCYHWGVSNVTAAKWRRALGVGRATEGTRQLYEQGSIWPSGKIVSKSYRLWTPEEEALVGTAPDKVIAQRLERSVYSVASRRRRLGKPSLRAG